MTTISEFGITINYFNNDDMMAINSEPSVVKVLDAARNWLYSGNYSKNLNSAKYQTYLVRYEKAIDKVVAKMGIDPKTARYCGSFGDLLS